MKLTILSTEDSQDSEFLTFFGRIQDTIIGFRDLLTLSVTKFPNFCLILLVIHHIDLFGIRLERQISSSPFLH